MPLGRTSVDRQALRLAQGWPNFPVRFLAILHLDIDQSRQLLDVFQMQLALLKVTTLLICCVRAHTEGSMLGQIGVIQAAVSHISGAIPYIN